MDAYSLLRKLLFRLDAETAHSLAMSFVAKGLVKGKLNQDPRLKTRAMGLEFRNPLGLAAGVDKDAHATNRWQDLGFGFAEIGTITWHAQPGNPKPRLFRYPEQRAIINRMGFNNSGAEVVQKRLTGLKSTIPIGINLGKSKVTPNNEAIKDYSNSFGLLAPLADYVVINVSSPNTPGLRDLQQVEFLSNLISELRKGASTIPPLLVKLAPDLADEDILAISNFVHDENLEGIIATNTTIGRPLGCSHLSEAGGLSGAPLKDRSFEVLQLICSSAKRPKTVVSVGGIESGTDLIHRLQAGANLCQAYTGWVFGGPNWPAKVLLELLHQMEQQGVSSLEAISSC